MREEHDTRIIATSLIYFRHIKRTHNFLLSLLRARFITVHYGGRVCCSLRRLFSLWVQDWTHSIGLKDKETVKGRNHIMGILWLPSFPVFTFSKLCGLDLVFCLPECYNLEPLEDAKLPVHFWISSNFLLKSGSSWFASKSDGAILSRLSNTESAALFSSKFCTHHLVR